MGALIVVDALWGDSGKGKITAFLCHRENASLCVRAGIGTNAGHSVYLSEETLIYARQLPLGFLHPTTTVAVGSGVALDPHIFHEEVNRYNLQKRVKIDYRCPIITEEHIRRESEDVHLKDTIGSTCSGSGAAQSDFVLRKALQAKDIQSLQPYLGDIAQEANESACMGTIVVECSQGTFLSLALSPDYPFVTAGNCTATAAADDVGLSWRNISGVVLLVKSVPSRVGPGPLPGELSTEEVQQRGIAEYGVVTGRLRRKASGIPWDLLHYAAMLNSPTEIALTFCDHYDSAIAGATNHTQITPNVWDLITKVEEVTNAPVTIVETGKLLEHIIDLRGVKHG